MTTDENIMSEMLERAVNRDNSDELGVQMFCLIVRSNPQMISKAQEKILEKIRSTNVIESIRAISLLEECMSKCGTEFQDEVSKFRFLNELIRLVSKKYQGDETPIQIKQRILECLLLWTTEFPQKLKIRDAYDMLNKEGNVQHGDSGVVAKRENTLGIDEEMLSKLIQSNDPENFKRANLLIQYRVKQESKRMELSSQQRSLLNEIENTVSLLSQMLDTYENDDHKNTDGNDTVNLMRELYMSCKKHKVLLQRLPELIQNADEDLVAETLQINDVLQGTMKRYKEVIVHPPSTPSTAIQTKESSDLLSELLGINENKDIPIKASIPNREKSIKKVSNDSNVNTLDELKEIFDNIEKKESEIKYPKELLSNIDILQPVNVFNTDENEKLTTNNDMPEKAVYRELREIDKLSEELFKQNIQSGDRIGSFKKITPEKLTLNDLLRERTQIKPEALPNNPSEQENLICDTSSIKEKISSNHEDDEILSGHIERKNEEEPPRPSNGENAHSLQLKPLEKPQLHLSEIEVDLDELTPCGAERILLDDDDIKITLNFTEDRPCKNVSVIVIAVSNKSKQALKNFHFEASVKKPSKVRLLPPTNDGLPPYKPYRPPTPINQVLLLLNPTEKDVDVTCIFGYTLGEDPDPIKESIVVKGISYVT